MVLGFGGGPYERGTPVGVGVQCSGIRVQGSGFRFSEFRVQGSEFRVQGSGFRVQGSGFQLRMHGSGSRVQGHRGGGRVEAREDEGEDILLVHHVCQPVGAQHQYLLSGCGHQVMALSTVLDPGYGPFERIKTMLWAF